MKSTNHFRLGLKKLTCGIGIFFLAPHAVSTAEAQTNTFSGKGAGEKVTSGKNNTGTGYKALNRNKTGGFNTAVGSTAMRYNVSGRSNTALGIAALFRNSSGAYNTAGGGYSLKTNLSGKGNAAYGYQSLFMNTVGDSNVAVGNGALSNNTSGDNNIGIGANGGSLNTVGNNNINIGNQGVAGSASGIIRIGTEGTHSTTLLAGKVGIGTTNPSGHLTVNEGKLIVDGSAPIDTANFTGLGFQYDLGAGEGAIMASFFDGHAGLGFYTKDDFQPITKRMVIDKIGNVGIGFSNPSERLHVIGNTKVIGNSSVSGNIGIGVDVATKGKLEVNGTAGNYAYGQRGVLSYVGAGSQSNISTDSPSIWASNNVWATMFLAFSDERIKKVEGRSDSARDLSTLLGIEVTDYTYIDTVSRGSGPVKKVVAQQVRKVYPQAVNRSTDVVPDIYKDATIKDGWISLSTNLKKGDRVRIIDGTKDGIHEVTATAPDGFRTAYRAEGGDVFVYGREVNDFLGVDYEALAMLNVSATQELARKLEARETEIARLQAENTSIKQKLAGLETRNEARLAAIEAHLSAKSGELITVSTESN